MCPDIITVSMETRYKSETWTCVKVLCFKNYCIHTVFVSVNIFIWTMLYYIIVSETKLLSFRPNTKSVGQQLVDCHDSVILY